MIRPMSDNEVGLYSKAFLEAVVKVRTPLQRPERFLELCII